MKKIGKILAANRSEIAIRIFRAAEESGIKTAAIYSKEDRFAIHRFKTDESYLVGKGKGPIQAYLDIDSIIKIAKDAKVDAIHPGYGFLSESPELSEQCEKNDITFIGPSKEILKRFGNKTEAKKVAEEANVGTVPSVLVTKENLKRISNIEGKISFKKVNFTYKQDNQVLKNINLEIKKGEVTAFVGASGAGKSTMLALILKFITPNKGNVFIDDKNIKILNTKDIRKNIALVQQQPFLFSGKIIDVIRMGRNFTEEEVIESARKANAHDFIQKLPEKYETNITERGSNFSGGQIQRLAIARAILGNPSILLLDEATSALDAESESEVQKGLISAMKDRTVIVIAHRLATTQEANKIVVFDKGEIIEVGKHIDLINKPGIYKELCEKQFIKKL